MDKEKTYIEVDIDKLSTALAENDWMHETKTVHTDDLWEIELVEMPHPVPVMEVKKTVRSKWAHLFFSLKERYIELIMSCSKPQRDGSSKEESTGNTGSDTV